MTGDDDFRYGYDMANEMDNDPSYREDLRRVFRRFFIRVGLFLASALAALVAIAVWCGVWAVVLAVCVVALGALARREWSAYLVEFKVLCDEYELSRPSGQGGDVSGGSFALDDKVSFFVDLEDPSRWFNISEEKRAKIVAEMGDVLRSRVDEVSGQ